MTMYRATAGSSQRQKISVCIPAKNSGRTIESCLSSAKEIADEIVVMDCRSTDSTVEICRKYDAKIFEHDFRGFGELYRALYQNASYEWVLVLDSDEELSEALRKEILQCVNEDRDTIAYEVQIRNYMFGRLTHISLWLPRLRKKEAIQQGGNRLEPEISVKAEFANKTRRLKNPIVHHTYESTSMYIAKFQQYTSLKALKFVESGRDQPYFVLS
jgi:glycosyltransferase involved in cell wall biosynthesis